MPTTQWGLLTRMPTTRWGSQIGSQQRGLKPHDSREFMYNVKRQGKKDSVMWQCISRNRGQYCPVIVPQQGENFTLGVMPHNHQATVGLHMITEVHLTD